MILNLKTFCCYIQEIINLEIFSIEKRVLGKIIIKRWYIYDKYGIHITNLNLVFGRVFFSNQQEVASRSFITAFIFYLNMLLAKPEVVVRGVMRISGKEKLTLSRHESKYFHFHDLKINVQYIIKMFWIFCRGNRSNVCWVKPLDTYWSWTVSRMRYVITFTLTFTDYSSVWN